MAAMDLIGRLGTLSDLLILGRRERGLIQLWGDFPVPVERRTQPRRRAREPDLGMNYRGRVAPVDHVLALTH